MALVSIIITTHSRPDLLPRAVASARTAGRCDLEIVVVDDASTDETREVCRSLEGTIYVRTDRNQGVAGARNLGILRSQGEYLCFLDDDDIRLPGSLDEQVATLTKDPDPALVYGQAILGLPDGSPTDKIYPAECPQGDIFWELLTRNFIPAGTAVFRRSAVYRIGLLDDTCPGVDDWDLWVRLAEIYPVKALENPVMVWRQATPTSEQGSSHARAMVRLSAAQFKNRWRRLPRFSQAPVTQQRETWRRFSNTRARHLLWETWRSALAGRLWNAQKNLAASVTDHPLETARVVLDPASIGLLSTHARQEQVTGASRHSIIEIR